MALFNNAPRADNPANSMNAAQKNSKTIEIIDLRDKKRRRHDESDVNCSGHQSFEYRLAALVRENKRLQETNDNLQDKIAKMEHDTMHFSIEGQLPKIIQVLKDLQASMDDDEDNKIEWDKLNCDSVKKQVFELLCKLHDEASKLLEIIE